jgi:hypothetical protein
MTFHPTFDENGYDTTDYESVVDFSTDVYEDIDRVLTEGFKAMNRMNRETEEKLNTIEEAYNAYLDSGDLDSFIDQLGEVF